MWPTPDSTTEQPLKYRAGGSTEAVADRQAVDEPAEQRAATASAELRQEKQHPDRHRDRGDQCHKQRYRAAAEIQPLENHIQRGTDDEHHRRCDHCGPDQQHDRSGVAAANIAKDQQPECGEYNEPQPDTDNGEPPARSVSRPLFRGQGIAR